MTNKSRMFLDVKLFLGLGLQEDEIEEAIKIASKFCEERFGLVTCIENSKDITQFCVTTLFFAKHRTYKRRVHGRADMFIMRYDYHNALDRALKDGEIIFHAAHVSKHISDDDCCQNFSVIYTSKKNQELHYRTKTFLSEHYFVKQTHRHKSNTEEILQELLPVWQRKLISNLSSISVSHLMREMKLSRADAGAIMRILKRKAELAKILANTL